MKSDEHMPVQDIDTSYNHTKEVQLESTSHSTRVHIDDVPPHKRERSLIELYMKSLAFTECTVKQYGKSFMATFQQPIGRCTLCLSFVCVYDGVLRMQISGS